MTTGTTDGETLATTDTTHQLTFEKETHLDQVIGRRLTQIREAALMSPADLAMLCSLPQETITEHESGEIPIPLSRLRTIAAALDTHAVDLICRLVFHDS